jgi:hypothetical protein
MVLTAILLPTTVCFARIFATVFELPFQRHRGWTALRRAIAAHSMLLLPSRAVPRRGA